MPQAADADPATPAANWPTSSSNDDGGWRKLGGLLARSAATVSRRLAYSRNSQAPAEWWRCLDGCSNGQRRAGKPNPGHLCLTTRSTPGPGGLAPWSTRYSGSVTETRVSNAAGGRHASIDRYRSDSCDGQLVWNGEGLVMRVLSRPPLRGRGRQFGAGGDFVNA